MKHPPDPQIPGVEFQPLVEKYDPDGGMPLCGSCPVQEDRTVKFEGKTYRYYFRARSTAELRIREDGKDPVVGWHWMYDFPDARGDYPGWWEHEYCRELIDKALAEFFAGEREGWHEQDPFTT